MIRNIKRLNELYQSCISENNDLQIHNRALLIEKKALEVEIERLKSEYIRLEIYVESIHKAAMDDEETGTFTMVGHN